MSRDLVYQFSVADAQQWKSADIAVILFNLRFWLCKNLANEHNIHDGQVWTYNTLSAWTELFPWLSADQIRRLLKKLEQSGLLVKGNYSENKFDKTVWYSLKEPEFCLNQPEPPVVVDVANSPHRESEPAASMLRNRRSHPVESPHVTDNKQQISKSVKNNARAENFSLDQIIVNLQTLGLPEKETWYARMKATEYLERFPESQSIADACRYVGNAIEHAWGLEGKTQ